MIGDFMSRQTLQNQKGAILIVALLLLLVLTILGISLINTATFDIQISGNERVRTDAFYAAEAGIQRAINQLPSRNAIPRSTLKEETFYWSGGPADKGAPKPIESLGLYVPPGDDIERYTSVRIKANATGESFNGMKELEVQVTFGPLSAGTGYNN